MSEANALFNAAIQKITSGGFTIEELIQHAGQLQAAGALEQARQLYKVWLSFNREHPLRFIAHFNCSTLLVDLKDDPGAVEELRAALSVKPDFAPACINLGSALERQGQANVAVETWKAGLDKMTAVTGDAINYKITLLKQISRVLSDNQHLALAEIALQQCLDVNPEQRDVAEQYGAVRLAQCKWPIMPDGAKPSRKSVVSRLHPLSMCAYSDDPLLQLAASDRYVRTLLPVDERHMRFDRRNAPIDLNGRRIKVGYVSSDLRNHAVGHLAVQLFEEHDRSQVEVFAYYCGIVADDPIHQRCKAAAEHWINIRGMTDDDAAARIAADGIDILIDVNGHTRDARLGVFARRPAPIQVNWLGYPGTMGTPFHHYIVGDDWTIPESHETYYSERVLRMPVYQPNDRKRVIAPEEQGRAEHGLPENAFVFACFNASHKITRFSFNRWLEILRAAPDSVLWLLDYGVETNKSLQAYADANGVAGSRLVFAPKMPNAKHLARYQLADLVLDTTPYGAHTTASDALWVGVPVITHLGRCFAARVCGSLVRAAGLEHLVCDTPEAYVAKAIALATTDRAALADCRKHLKANRDTCLLFDIQTYARSIEGLYQQMCAEYVAGEMPQPNLANLDTYFETGVALEHEVREMGKLEDYDGFYAAKLAARHLQHPLQPDGRLWSGEPERASAAVTPISEARAKRKSA